MLVILEVQGGTQSGRRITLQSGQIVRVGRRLDADIAFPEDSYMSGLHCVLQCGVKICALRDYDSTNGVMVNGNKILRSVDLKDGDEIVAGRTHFTVHVQESHESSPNFQDTAAASRSLLNVLRGEFQPLYAILDAARDKKILALLRLYETEHQCLYEGERVEELAQVAPYLVRLQPESPLLFALEHEGCGKSWGVYLTCNLPLKELRDHLRQFLTVKLPKGDRAFFRYYDPRVMRAFLPASKKEEAAKFFGPVKGYLVEDEKVGEFLRLSMASEGVAKAKLILRVTDAGAAQMPTQPLFVPQSAHRIDP